MQQSKDDNDNIIISSLNKCKNLALTSFFICFAANALGIIPAVYSLQLLDRVISSKSTDTLISLSIITFFAIACMTVIEHCKSLILNNFADWLETTTTTELLSKTVALISVNKRVSSGEMMRDFYAIKTFFSTPGVFAFLDVPWIPIYLFIIYCISPTMLTIAIVGIVAMIIMAFANVYFTDSINKAINEKSMKNIGDLEVTTRNAETLEAMGMTPDIIRVWRQNSEHTKNLQKKSGVRTAAIMSLTKCFRMTLQSSIMAFGVYGIISDPTNASGLGGIIASSILISKAMAPLDNAVHTWRSAKSALISYNRLKRILDASPKRMQSMSLPRPEGHISFDKVFFTPIGHRKPTIKGISLDIKAGETVAVVGPSASGKSTLMKLLAGVWSPISGVVRLDGADVYTWNRKDFGKYVGYLPQDVELFNVSIKDNIARMSEENFNEDKIIDVARMSSAEQMILNFPHGYDTLLGPEGYMLSGGQKQRIGIARAFYNNPAVVILDEPNANLDRAGDVAFMQTIQRAQSKGATIILTTHKMEILSSVDKILVLNDGVVTNYGTPEEVLRPKEPQQKSEPSQKISAKINTEIA